MSHAGRPFAGRLATLALIAGAAASALTPTPATAKPKSKAKPKAPLVEVTFVSRAGTLHGPLQVRAAQTTMKVAGRRCAVAAGTPLAALAALQRKRAAGVGRLAVIDYGGCNGRPSGSSGAYLRGVGKERAAGPDGWIYDVAGRRGTSGAADVAGPFGNGKRLRSGQHVAWRWCHAASDPLGGCGAELRFASIPARASASAPLTVKVAERAGADGEEKTTAARAGVRVRATTLAGAELATAVTVAGGNATLTLPSGTAGRVRVVAEHDRFAPAGRLVVVRP